MGTIIAGYEGISAWIPIEKSRLWTEDLITRIPNVELSQWIQVKHERIKAISWRDAD